MRGLWSASEIRLTIPMFLCTFLLLLQLSICYDRDTISLYESVTDHNQSLVSAGQKFQLGFFTPDESPDNRRYVGIWYYALKNEEVWAANRDKALPIDNTGIFTLAEDGGVLILLDKNNKSYWTSGGKSRSSSETERKVTLMDSGNLVLSEEDPVNCSWKVLWQSFDHPTDTFLPGMKMEKDTKLTSWKSSSDPGTGRFTFQLAQGRDNQYMIQESGSPDKTVWKSRVYGDLFTSRNDITRILLYLLPTFSSPATFQEPAYSRETKMINFTRYLKPSGYNNTRLFMNFEGKIQFLEWNDKTTAWSVIREEPSERCSVFKACGDLPRLAHTKIHNSVRV